MYKRPFAGMFRRARLRAVYDVLTRSVCFVTVQLTKQGPSSRSRTHAGKPLARTLRDHDGGFPGLAYVSPTRWMPTQQRGLPPSWWARGPQRRCAASPEISQVQPQQESFVWSGWVLAIALLGLEALSGVVRQAFGRGLIEPMVMGYDDFRRDLERTLADPARMAGFHYDQIEPLEDAIGELSGWYVFSDVAKQDQERWATSPEDAGLAFADTPVPFVDPFKGVGRNDPCPCGSGKKFKKCCLDRGSLRPSLPGLL